MRAIIQQWLEFSIICLILKADYNMGVFPQSNTQQVMRYQADLSFICCLAHILNLIAKEFLSILKASDVVTDYQLVRDLENNLSIIESYSTFSCI
jgi:hypothetical protein